MENGSIVSVRRVSTFLHRVYFFYVLTILSRLARRITGARRETEKDRDIGRTKEKEGRKEGWMDGWSRRQTHVAHSLGKLLTSFVLQPTLGLPLPPLLLDVLVPPRVSLFKSRNVRLTTQWKQQLHDRWSRPTDSIQRPLFLRSPPLLLLLRTGRYRRVYSRKQLGGEEVCPYDVDY